LKRSEFVRYLEKNNCILKREGGNHSIFINLKNNKVSSLPRHKEIKNFLCVKICKDLEIPVLSK